MKGKIVNKGLFRTKAGVWAGYQRITSIDDQARRFEKMRKKTWK